MNVGGLAPDREALLSGSEAVARGAIEAGLALAIGYPGAPGSEALDACFPAAGPDLRVEWAVNEKLAVEIAAGVAWSGKRALAAMKMSGLNVAADSVLSIAASGVNGALVLVVADDPGVYYGMVEQDSRYYALMGALPLLEPATPQEALDFARSAFDISERTGSPVVLRLTTVLAQNTGIVVPRHPERTRVRGAFAFDPDRFTKAGRARARGQHDSALARVEEVSRLLAPLVKVEAGSARTGAIGVGVAWRHLLEARARVAPEVPLLKLPASYPIPEEPLRAFLARLDRVVVVEELEPVVENAVRALAAGQPGLVVLGKAPAPGQPGTGRLPRVGEYDVDLVGEALTAAASPSPVAEAAARVGVGGERSVALPVVDSEGPGSSEPARRASAPTPAGRPPVFPAGCPHRGTYMALRQALTSLKLGPRDIVVTGDVGCTVLGAFEPFSACATEVAMGASIGVAQGFAYAGIGKPVVAAIGDGSFFHAGLPALVGAVHRQVALTLLVLDNGAACLTGGQAHAGSPGQEKGSRQIRLEDLARACQVKRVTTVDPYDVRRTAAAIAGAIKGGGVSMVIARRACEAFLAEPPAPPLEIRAKRCVGVTECENSCIAVTACPALQVDGSGKARIEASVCVGCRLCESVCPTRAIRRPWRFRGGGTNRGR